jgi:hypothetical protein
MGMEMCLEETRCFCFGEEEGEGMRLHPSIQRPWMASICVWADGGEDVI